MSETTHSEEHKEPQTPFDYMALFPGAPTPHDIESYRKQVPGGRLRLLPLKDGKRLFLLRGFTALELLGVQTEAAKLSPEKQVAYLQVTISVRCTIWTSIVTSGKLTVQDLENSGAGLASTLYHTIMDLSDYNDPQVLEQLFVDL
jgi:hypothetical protein